MGNFPNACDIFVLITLRVLRRAGLSWVELSGSEQISNTPLKIDNNTIKTLRIKSINEVHRSEIEIDPKIDLLDIESKTEIKVAANVAGTTSKSCYNAT